MVTVNNIAELGNWTNDRKSCDSAYCECPWCARLICLGLVRAFVNVLLFVDCATVIRTYIIFNNADIIVSLILLFSIIFEDTSIVS